MVNVQSSDIVEKDLALYPKDIYLGADEVTQEPYGKIPTEDLFSLRAKDIVNDILPTHLNGGCKTRTIVLGSDTCAGEHMHTSLALTKARNDPMPKSPAQLQHLTDLLQEDPPPADALGLFALDLDWDKEDPARVGFRVEKYTPDPSTNPEKLSDEHESKGRRMLEIMSQSFEKTRMMRISRPLNQKHNSVEHHLPTATLNRDTLPRLAYSPNLQKPNLSAINTCHCIRLGYSSWRDLIDLSSIKPSRLQIKIAFQSSTYSSNLQIQTLQI
ncbi:uncharacterized protein K460DRAFT_408802 [Cucurbitaria berberidis CBS 394.84]|uniref:Uncharacterized protein n=1 Tax=Cucurbitaria berberidis CBS 394.84 TaxID=1168544 RepID=A0A9P4L4V7_9PLEO|nr:uncharacterized protein K460DRAFT_408802 [Cucurbitaria berberidis CBS 394.84]KAF1841328.1 hypothetical protein K460DRAFT_408802 [Cucurbitaria berberidis CBS 394.84]